jgi:hypothetical protein
MGGGPHNVVSRESQGIEPVSKPFELQWILGLGLVWEH